MKNYLEFRRGSLVSQIPFYLIDDANIRTIRETTKYISNYFMQLFIFLIAL